MRVHRSGPPSQAVRAFGPGFAFLDEIEPAGGDGAAEGGAFLEMGIDRKADVFGNQFRQFAVMALHRTPAVARKVPGVGLGHLEMELETIGGPPYPQTLIGADTIRHQAHGASRQIETVFVQLHDPVFDRQPLQQRIAPAGRREAHRQITDLKIAEGPNGAAEGARYKLGAEADAQYRLSLLVESTNER